MLAAIRVFEQAFKEFGLPAALRTDNGLLFAVPTALYRLLVDNSGRHTKNREPHRVARTVDVVALIRAQLPESRTDRNEYVFIGRGRDLSDRPGEEGAVCRCATAWN